MEPLNVNNECLKPLHVMMNIVTDLLNVSTINYNKIYTQYVVYIDYMPKYVLCSSRRD